MAGPTVRIETRNPAAGEGRQIAPRRFGTAGLIEREDELHGAIHTVIATMVRAVEDAPASSLNIGKLEVTFNVAFATDEGVYLCSSPADATFEVKLSLALAEPGSNPSGARVDEV